MNVIRGNEGGERMSEMQGYEYMQHRNEESYRVVPNPPFHQQVRSKYPSQMNAYEHVSPPGRPVGGIINVPDGPHSTPINDKVQQATVTCDRCRQAGYFGGRCIGDKSHQFCTSCLR